MGNEFYIYIFKIIIYVIMLFFIYFIVQKQYLKKRKLSVAIKVFISLLFMIYSIISTAHPYVMDKVIYALKFSSNIYSEQVFMDSIGLWFVQYLLHFFTYNPLILFSFISFSFTYIILTAYNRCEEAKPISLLLLLVGEFFIFSFYQLKQCISTALITLSLVEYFNNKKISSFLYMIIAFLFHESSLIVIPVLVLLKGNKNKLIRLVEYLGFMLFILFFNQINNIIIKLFVLIIPSLANDLSIYIDDYSIITSVNFMTILKGLPFYIITAVAILERKKLKDMKNIDSYILLSCINCVTIILSGYMYWMFRFGIYFHFSNAILATYVIDSFEKDYNRRIFKLIVITISLLLTIKLWVQYYFNYGGV